MALAHAFRRRTGRTPQAPARRMGTWKLAYADFLTALVAFFIVMWLVKGLPEAGRADIAGYFRDGSEIQQSTDDGDSAEARAEAAAARLADSLSRQPLLRAEADVLRVVQDGTRVRIDLTDRLSDPVFMSAGAGLTPAGEALAEELAGLLKRGDWPVEIEGHTDAFPHAGAEGGNWALSTERALAARDALIGTGLDESRLTAVTGRADTLPINPGEPHHSANRRITLVLQVTE